MEFEILQDSNLLALTKVTEDELFTLDKSLNKLVDGWNFKKKYAKNGWNGKVQFFKNDTYIPLGIRSEVVDIANKFNYPITFIDEQKLYCNDINKKEFFSLAKTFFKKHKITPYPYQIETAYQILYNKACLGELATSAGKTLIVFMTILYQIKTNPKTKILMVVPNISLVEQAINDFDEYDPNNELKLTIQPIYSGTKQIENANIVVGTYQSLVKKDKEYYKQFNCVLVDEVHKTTAKSIRQILQNCLHCKYRYGVSGTIQPPQSIDRWDVMSYLGPIIKEVKASYLMKNGYITPLKIKVLELEHTNKEFIESLYSAYKIKDSDKAKILTAENKYIASNVKRLKLVNYLVNKANGNCILLFKHIKYGKTLFEYLKANTTNKRIYYIDGGVSEEKRAFAKAQAEKYDNVVLIASYGTSSTGISIKNLKYGFLLESLKDEKVLRQSIGRLLRKHKNKKLAIVYDLMDNLSYVRRTGTRWINYLMKHGAIRIDTYNSEKFDYTIKKIKI